MAYSMTGFGRGEKVFDTRKYSIELKSVNSRFCDISIRMPRIFNYLDGDIRRVITDRLLRGKIDVFINYEDQGEAGQTVTVNTGLAKEYARAAKEIADLTGREDDFGVARLATMQDVLLSRLVITFLPRSKRLLISWLQSPSTVILEPKM